MRKILIIFTLLFPIIIFADVNSTYGPTAKTDQLWQIAIFVRPNASVSIAQTMAALKKINPNAFVGDKLKTGVMLQVPTLIEIKQIGFPAFARNDGVKAGNDAKKLQNLFLKLDEQYQNRTMAIAQQNLIMQKQITALKEQNIALQNTLNKLINYAWYTITGFLGLLLIIILVIKPKKQVIQDEEDEYDFMGSDEGIPAKLDLARAYLDMNDQNAAREVLDEITKQGNEQQQQEAQDLLKRIK